KTVKAAPDKDVPKAGVIKSFLPDSLKLPMPMDMKANLSLAGISYKGADFNSIKIGIDKKGGVINISESVGQMPGGGTLSGKSSMNFASGSGSDKNGVIYSNPTLSFDVKANSATPAKLFGAFLPDDALKSMQPLLKNALNLSASGNVKGARAGIDNGS